MVNLRYKTPYRYENRLYLGRWRWEREGRAGDVSHELTVSLCFIPRFLFAGVYVEPKEYGRTAFHLCLLPCISLRVKFRRSWGGRFG